MFSNHLIASKHYRAVSYSLAMWIPALVLTVVALCGRFAVSQNSVESSSCEGDINITSLMTDSSTTTPEQLAECQEYNGSITINLADEEADYLLDEDFNFLSNITRIYGALTFENFNLMDQVVISSLQHIEGNGGANALQVLNVSGGDIIFPNLTTITKGDVVFNITSDTCGYLGINWSLILQDGTLGNQSDCIGPECGNCTSGYCWSESYCQMTDNPSSTTEDEDDPFYIVWWNEQRALVIGVGSGIIVIIILLHVCCCCCCCYLCCRWRRKKYATSMRTVGTTESIDAGVHKYNSFGLSEMPSVRISSEPVDPPKQHKIIVIQPDRFELAHLIGNGSCGEVHKGYWHTDVDTVSYSVAIKAFGTPSSNYKLIIEEKLQKFLGLEHENVLRLCSVSYSSQLMLAYEYVPTNLRQHVMQNKLMLSAMDMIVMATQIAKGMDYLASKGISHGNLAARNVMVQPSNVIKVTDYNLYDLTAPSDWLPIRWLAPETLKYRKHNEKSDMWSYGVTIWELMTFGAHPYHGKPTEDMLKSLEDGQRLLQPVTVTGDLYSILVECWWLDPMMRPSFNKMVKTMATCQSNPSQYVLTMVDGKLETYLKLPPAATNANPYENLADIDEAGYLLMMSRVPASPGNSLDPRGALHGGSINSNSQAALSSFMSDKLRVKDEKYTKVPATETVQDEIYINSQPEQNIYDDTSNPTKPSEPYVQDEMYVNPESNQGELYELMDRKDSPDSDNQEMYVIPDLNTNTEQGDKHTKTQPQTGEELYVNPEENNIYDDTTNLMDESGYEKMKSGVSINNINAVYAQAAQQDQKPSAQEELYEIPDSKGYKNTKDSTVKPPSQEDETDEYLLDRNPMLTPAYNCEMIYSD